jgi:hypothetical protein
LGKWITNQRNIHKCQLQKIYGYNPGPFWNEKEAKLNAIGFCWVDPPPSMEQQKVERSWDEFYRELQSFKRNHGACYVPRDFQNRSLVDWVTIQRVNYARKSRGMKTPLDHLREAKLDVIGFCWKPDDDPAWQTALYLHDYDDSGASSSEDEDEDEEEEEF